MAKITDITAADAAEFLHLSEYNAAQLQFVMESAAGYMESYTGLPVTAEGGECLDDYPDCATAFRVLVQDMWDNRAYIESGAVTVNKTVDSILNLHRRVLVC